MLESDSKNMGIIDQIRFHFSKNAFQYDQYSSIQQQSASILHQFIQELDLFQTHQSIKPILEIGCGTGLLSSFLLDLFPKKEIHFTDISSAMLEECKKKIGLKNSNSIFFTMNGENVSSENKYSLIVSSFTLQWFQNFQTSIKKIIDSLEKKGLFIFCFPTEESFKEWKEKCKQLNIPYTGNKLPSLHDLNACIDENKVTCSIFNKWIKIYYPNAKLFFQHLKKIGANSTFHHHRLSTSQMKQLLYSWSSKKDNEIYITYNISYGYFQKI